MRGLDPRKDRLDVKQFIISEEQDRNLRHDIENRIDRKVRDIPGAGAAGGLGAGLLAFGNARLKAGIAIVIRCCRYAERIDSADLIITGEGRIDATTIRGKTIAGIAKQAQKQSIPVIALAGSLSGDVHKLLEPKLPDYPNPVSAVLSICPGPVSLEHAIEHAPALLADTAEQALRLILLKSNT